MAKDKEMLKQYINEAVRSELYEALDEYGWGRKGRNEKWGYEWDNSLSRKQNRRLRKVNKAQIKALGYKNADEYESHKGYKFGEQPDDNPQQQQQNTKPEGVEIGQPAPFYQDKYKTGQFQTWFNKEMGGNLVVDGIWGKYTQAAWDTWVKKTYTLTPSV